MISIYQGKDHRWRDAYSPLRGLSMPKLVSLLEAGERGQYADLQWFYHYMEQSDAMIAAVLQRRRAAWLSVDWDIRLAADSVSSEQGAVGSWQREGGPETGGGAAAIRIMASKGAGDRLKPALQTPKWSEIARS